MRKTASARIGMLWVFGLTACVSLAAARLCRPRTVPVASMPMNGLSAIEVRKMSAMRIAGLAGDRTQIAGIVAIVNNSDKEHPYVTETALHTLAQLGALEAQTAIDNVIQRRDFAGLTAYAKVSRARLLAEYGAAHLTGSAKASAKLDRFFQEVGMSPDDLKSGVLEFYEQRSHGPAFPTVAVLAMREVADMVYNGNYADYPTNSKLKQIDFTVDYPSALKMRLAPLSKSERVKWLLDDLSHRVNLGNEVSYEQQLAIDEGARAGQAADSLLATMKTHHSAYPSEGFVALLDVVTNSGDKAASKTISQFLTDSDPDVADHTRNLLRVPTIDRAAHFAPAY